MKILGNFTLKFYKAKSITISVPSEDPLDFMILRFYSVDSSIIDSYNLKVNIDPIPIINNLVYGSNISAEDFCNRIKVEKNKNKL